jgi:hypothetical protein
MVRRTATAPPAPPPAPTLEEEIQQEKEDTRRLETEEWLTEFRERFTDQPATVLVEKFDDNEWAICRRYALSTFDYESVLNEFGGGIYRATLIGPDGRYVKEGRTRFKFAAPIVKPSNTATAPTNPLDNPIVAMMLKAQEAQTAQSMEITKALIATGGGGKGSDIGQLIVALKGLQDLTPKEKPMQNFKETLDMIKTVKEISGDTDSKGGLLSDLRDFLEVWPTVKEKFAEIKPPAGSAAPAATPMPAIPERKPATLDPLTEKIVKLVPKYVTAAKKSEPIETWGDTLLADFDTEILPILTPMMKKQYGVLVKDEDDVYDILLRYAKDPKEREVIFRDITPLAPFREWVNRVVDEAIRLAETEPAEVAATDVVVEAVAGNGRDTSGG